MEAPKKQTEMVAASDKKAKMVKIKALRDIRVDGKMVKPGEVVEVSSEEAQDFCKKYQGAFGFSGERPNNETVRQVFSRAELVGEVS
jgi:hypothetical protein